MAKRFVLYHNVAPSIKTTMSSSDKEELMDRLQFAYPFLLWWLFPVLIGVALYVLLFKRQTRYRYAMVHTLIAKKQVVQLPVKTILYLLNLCALTLLTLLIARPQWIDSSSSTMVHGVDIVLALDVSGSMECFDDMRDQTTRIEAAKREALDFIKRRTDDPIGIVLFGKDALSKVPLTLDKALLQDVVSHVEIGDVDPSGTAMMTGLGTAINRLRASKSTSKVIVLLTDGVPQEDQIRPDVIIDVARQFGIKIYTLGVGREGVAYTKNIYGFVQQVASDLDEPLLRRLADETGGHFFRVQTPRDLKQAYQKIDALEKTKIETALYHRHYEAFAWFIWWFLLLFCAGIILRSLIWRGV